MTLGYGGIFGTPQSDTGVEPDFLRALMGGGVETSLPQDPYANTRPQGGRSGFLDTLGRIGDALSGGSSYRDFAKDRDSRAAMQGFIDNPLAAIGRLAQVDPGAALKAYGDYQQNQALSNYRVSTLEDRDLTRQAIEDDRKFKRDLKTEGIIGGLLNAATASTYPAILPRIKALAAKNGYDISQLDLPDSFDETAIGALRNLGTTAYQNETIDTRRRGQDISERNNIRSTDTSTANNVRSTNASMRNADVRDAGADRRQKVSETGRERRSKKPEIRYGPDGRRYIKGPNGKPVLYNGE